MSGRCPLGGGINWSNRGEIPEYCFERCGELWSEASQRLARIDIFNTDCMEACPIEFEDEALQRGVGSQRQYSILNICMNHHREEMFAEEYDFECPYN